MISDAAAPTTAAPRPAHLLPLLAGVLAAASFVMMDATIKSLTPRYDALQLTFFRFASGSVFALALWLWQRSPLPRGASAWRRRRAWDTLDVSKLHFMRKVALLIEKGSAGYGRIDSLYEVRCAIAHGEPRRVGAIDLAAEYQQICRLWRELRT